MLCSIEVGRWARGRVPMASLPAALICIVSGCCINRLGPWQLDERSSPLACEAAVWLLEQQHRWLGLGLGLGVWLLEQQPRWRAPCA